MLGASGDVAARARALRAIGAEGGGLRRTEGWLSAQSLTAMLRAVRLDRRQARRVGQALVRPDGVGLALCYGGLATPEKTYRRADQLLAREAEVARYEPREISGERGRMLFHPPPEGHAERLEPELGALLCGVREGMLEAVPLLFGLLPARVRERDCAYRSGAECCVFELSWSRTQRRGLIAGALAGVPMAAGSAIVAMRAGLPGWASALAGLGALLLAAAAGRSLDLARQLEAVAGSRRGQLALLDQLDKSLAEKMDELAKVGSANAPEAASAGPATDIHGLVPVGGERRGGQGGADGTGAADAARSLRESVSELRGGLAELQMALGDPAGDASRREERLRECAAHGRRIEALAVELDRRLHGGERLRERRGLAAIIERVVAGLRDELPGGPALALDLASETPAALCDEAQIEYVLEQLVRNAAEAAGQQGSVRVALSATPTGVEVAVEDDGEGIEQQAVDEVFDPFSAPQTLGRDTSFGLPVCYRIVEEHGGELQVQSAEGRGTRVSVLLPLALAEGPLA